MVNPTIYCYEASGLLSALLSFNSGDAMKAIWNGRVIAESDETVIVESNHYFPRNSIVQEFYSQSNKTTHCPWKGDASYFNIEVDGSSNQNGAWFYVEPKEAAKEIANMVAFWNGIEVIE
jgi:uncharacterized protein (DUF427 family)